jgi:hypothetical protein
MPKGDYRSSRRFRPDQITQYGFEAYAVYGGYVYSFKCPKVSGDRIYDVNLLDAFLAATQKGNDQ